MQERIDAGVVTIIPTEIDALFRIFGIDRTKHLRRAGSLEYWKTNLFSPRNGRYLNVAVSFIYGTAGNIESAITATLMSELLRPRTMCLVGIAAGAEGRTKIGNVVFPDSVHDATITVRKKDNVIFPRIKGYQLDGRIVRQLKIQPMDQAVFAQKAGLPQEAIDKLKTLAASRKLNPDDIADPVSILDGSIVSGNVLLRDSTYFPEFQATNDERCRALEMEAAGFVRACELTGTPWVVMRGISDYGDDRKGDEFQHFAASNASHAMRQFLEYNIDLSVFPRNASDSSELILFDTLEGSLSKAYEESQWNYVVEIGSFLSRPLWIAGKYEVRRRIGLLVEDSAAHCKRNADRASALIDDVGWTTYMLGEAHQAEKYISDGLRLADIEGNFYLCAKASRHLASIARQNEDYELCHERLKKAEDYAKRLGNHESRQEMDVTLKLSTAKLLIVEKKPDEAIKLLEEAEKQFLALGEPFRVVKIYKILGDAYEDNGNPSMAMNNYKKGYERSSGIGRKDEALGNAVSLSILYAKQENAPEAQYWANIAIELVSEMPGTTLDAAILDILKAGAVA